MARKVGFSDRFPFAGLFLVIAIALAVPLTVFSLNNVSTQTKQEAAGLCDGAPYIIFYDCKNFELNSNCGSQHFCSRYNSFTGKYTISSVNMGTYMNYNDKAESIQLVNFPYAYKVRFYENENWGGGYFTQTVTSSREKIPDLSKISYSGWMGFQLLNGFANKITSFKSL